MIGKYPRHLQVQSIASGNWIMALFHPREVETAFQNKTHAGLRYVAAERPELSVPQWITNYVTHFPHSPTWKFIVHSKELNVYT